MVDVDEATGTLARRIRTELLAGSTLDDVLRTLRAEEHGLLRIIAALRRASGMNLGTSKTIVARFWEGRSYARMTLDDLDILGNAPRVGGVDFITAMLRDDAIIDRKPWLLYARQCAWGVACASSEVPIAALPAHGRHGSVSGTFESVAASTRTAAAAWPTEIAIECDEADAMLVRFLRATTP
jgi:hypothetical protein